KNVDTPVEKAASDYLAGMRKAYPVASYLTINISSPNTRDLRRLQEADELRPLLASLKQEQRILAQRHERYVPLAVKIAPDLDDEQLAMIARIVLAHKIDDGIESE